MKTQSGDSVIIMIPATVRVSPMKLIMEIQSRMKMILTTLFVLKVSRMTLQKPNGETVMIKKLLIVKVNLMKHIMKIRNTFKMILMNDPLCAEGELDDDDEDEWKNGDDNKSIDNEGKSHGTYHVDLKHI